MYVVLLTVGSFIFSIVVINISSVGWKRDKQTLVRRSNDRLLGLVLNKRGKISAYVIRGFVGGDAGINRRVC